MEFSFVLASEFDRVTLPADSAYKKNFNITTGNSAFVITNDKTFDDLDGLSARTLKSFAQTQFKKSIKIFEFGLSGTDKKGTIVPRIKAEGDRNLRMTLTIQALCGRIASPFFPFIIRNDNEMYVFTWITRGTFKYILEIQLKKSGKKFQFGFTGIDRKVLSCLL